MVNLEKPEISIHPPRAGRDYPFLPPAERQTYFNPPAPCGAGRYVPGSRLRTSYFNPPAPCGAGPRAVRRALFLHQFQSTRPVRGGTRRCPRPARWCTPFQSTRPVRGGTLRIMPQTDTQEFQSTRPVRGGTAVGNRLHLHFGISIHPPRAGRDVVVLAEDIAAWISIHPPRAGRDDDVLAEAGAQPTFQSTRPVRGGTMWLRTFAIPIGISIHPPRAGRDTLAIPASEVPSLFQSTRPVRGGTPASYTCEGTTRFQSTRPVRGGTGCATRLTHKSGISIHPPRAGRDYGRCEVY